MICAISKISTEFRPPRLSTAGLQGTHKFWGNGAKQSTTTEWRGADRQVLRWRTKAGRGGIQCCTAGCLPYEIVWWACAAQPHLPLPMAAGWGRAGSANQGGGRGARARGGKLSVCLWGFAERQAAVAARGMRSRLPLGASSRVLGEQRLWWKNWGATAGSSMGCTGVLAGVALCRADLA